MNNMYTEYMLVQTVVDLNSQISSLTQFLNSNRFLEIGDDPGLVENIETVLSRMYQKVRSLQPHFDLDHTPLGKANIYFALIKDLNDALRYLQEVRKRDYGSRQHTRELLEKLNSCTHSIYAIGDLVSSNADIIH